MKVIDWNMQLHEDCRLPEINFRIIDDRHVYALIAHERCGSHLDSYLVETFNNPEYAWAAYMELQGLLLDREKLHDTVAWQWDDASGHFVIWAP